MEPKQLNQYSNNTTGWTTGVQFQTEAGTFFLFATASKPAETYVHTSPMGAGSYLPGSKATRAWNWPLTYIYFRGYKCVELWLHYPIRLHGMVLS
jgi:hypothetical protein